MRDETVREIRDRLAEELPQFACPRLEAAPKEQRMDRQTLARLIDHTELRPTATADDARTACEVALRAEVAAVCLSPRYVALAREVLAQGSVDVCTVVGFPHGTEAPEVKAFEARHAVSQGAQEIDMVISIGTLRAADFRAVHAEILEVRNAVLAATLKVIIETALLSDEEKVQAAVIAEWAQADFVKTSTGFSGGGATVEDVRLLRQAVGGGARVKASGGIRTAEQAKALCAAGAHRLGMSSTLQVLAGLRGETSA